MKRTLTISVLLLLLFVGCATTSNPVSTLVNGLNVLNSNHPDYVAYSGNMAFTENNYKLLLLPKAEARPTSSGLFSEWFENAKV